MSFMEMSRPSTPIPAEKPRTYHPQPTDREIERALSASEKRHQAGDIGLSSTLHDRKIFRIDKSILIKESTVFRDMFVKDGYADKGIIINTTSQILGVFLDAIKGIQNCCPPETLIGIVTLPLLLEYKCDKAARILLRHKCLEGTFGHNRLRALVFACQLDDIESACLLLIGAGAEEDPSIIDAKSLRPNSESWHLGDTESLSPLWFWALTSGIATADEVMFVNGKIDRKSTHYWTIVVGDFSMRLIHYKKRD